jgi:hypothetical protein
VDVGCALLGRVAQHGRHNFGDRRVFGNGLGLGLGDQLVLKRLVRFSPFFSAEAFFRSSS